MDYLELKRELDKVKPNLIQEWVDLLIQEHQLGAIKHDSNGYSIFGRIFGKLEDPGALRLKFSTCNLVRSEHDERLSKLEAYLADAPPYIGDWCVSYLIGFCTEEEFDKEFKPQEQIQDEVNPVNPAIDELEKRLAEKEVELNEANGKLSEIKTRYQRLIYSVQNAKDNLDAEVQSALEDETLFQR